MVPLLRALSIPGVLAVLLSVQGMPVAAQTGDGDKEQARLLKEAQARAKQAEELLTRLTAETKRLRAEAALLVGVLKSRDEVILKLMQEIQEMRNRAVAAELQARTALERAQTLLQQLREKEVMLARLQQQKGGPLVPPKGAIPENEANPPPAYIKGRIVSISAKDKTLVEISLGADAGLKVGHTLEVYRLKPQPQYLGRLRVLDVRERSATARLLKGPVLQGNLKAGDEVASRLTP